MRASQLVSKEPCDDVPTCCKCGGHVDVLGKGVRYMAKCKMYQCVTCGKRHVSLIKLFGSSKFDELLSAPPNEIQEFWSTLPLEWNAMRCKVTSFIIRIRKERRVNEVRGQFLPLSVYEKMGYDVAKIVKHTGKEDIEHHPILGATYRVKIRGSLEAKEDELVRKDVIDATPGAYKPYKTKAKHTPAETGEAAEEAEEAEGAEEAEESDEDGKKKSDGSSDSDKKKKKEKKEKKRKKEEEKKSKKKKKDSRAPLPARLPRATRGCQGAPQGSPGLPNRPQGSSGLPNRPPGLPKSRRRIWQPWGALGAIFQESKKRKSSSTSNSSDSPATKAKRAKKEAAQKKAAEKAAALEAKKKAKEEADAQKKADKAAANEARKIRVDAGKVLSKLQSIQKRQEKYEADPMMKGVPKQIKIKVVKCFNKVGEMVKEASDALQAAKPAELSFSLADVSAAASESEEDMKSLDAIFTTLNRH